MTHWQISRIALLGLIASMIPASVGFVEEGDSADKAEPESAKLKERAAYCQVVLIDGSSAAWSRADWAVSPGHHELDLECNYRERGAHGPGNWHTWTMRYIISFEAKPGGEYVLKDHLDGFHFEYAWLEDTATSSVVGGKRPGRFNPPDLIPEQDLLKNAAQLGTGAVLEFQYEAPSKPVNHLRLLVDKLEVLDTDGCADVTREFRIAPGEHKVEVRIQDKVRYSYHPHHLTVSLKPGQSRRLVVKGSHWAKSRVRVR